MSDFAVGFYEIIYKDFLVNRILRSDDGFFDKNFAGDTMSSFNSIANRVPKAGKCLKSRTSESGWPQWLRDYHARYHCLANFWVIPMEVGRKIGAPLCKGDYGNGVEDYMDRFLCFYMDKESEYKTKYSSYFDKFDGFKKFCESNFLLGSYLDSKAKVVHYSNSSDPEEIVGKINQMIEARASLIAQSPKCSSFFEFFEKYGLCDEA